MNTYVLKCKKEKNGNGDIHTEIMNKRGACDKNLSAPQHRFAWYRTAVYILVSHTIKCTCVKKKFGNWEAHKVVSGREKKPGVDQRRAQKVLGFFTLLKIVLHSLTVHHE